MTPQPLKISNMKNQRIIVIFSAEMVTEFKYIYNAGRTMLLYIFASVFLLFSNDFLYL